MSEIIKKRDGTGRYELNVKPQDYSEHPVKAPNSNFRQEQIIIDYTIPTNIDSARLMQVSMSLQPRDLGYYFYVLDMMSQNDKPVTVLNKELKEFFSEKWQETVSRGMTRVLRSGLLFQVEGKRCTYLVNPVYAWKGDRMNYLDVSAFIEFRAETAMKLSKSDVKSYMIA